MWNLFNFSKTRGIKKTMLKITALLSIIGLSAVGMMVGLMEVRVNKLKIQKLERIEKYEMEMNNNQNLE